MTQPTESSAMTPFAAFRSNPPLSAGELLTKLNEAATALAVRVNAAVQSCDLMGTDSIAIRRFSSALGKLNQPISNLQTQVSRYQRNPAIFDTNRSVGEAAFSEVSWTLDALEYLANRTTTFGAGDKVLVSETLTSLRKGFGFATERPYVTQSKALAAKVAALNLADFFTRLDAVKAAFAGLSPQPSLAISFSFDDEDIAKLIKLILDHGLSDVRIITDEERQGPESGKDIGRFQGELLTVDRILVVGSRSFGWKARATQSFGVQVEGMMIAQRYVDDYASVIRFLVDGSAQESFPLQASTMQTGYLNAIDERKFLHALAQAVKAVYFPFFNRDETDPEGKGAKLIADLLTAYPYGPVGDRGGH